MTTDLTKEDLNSVSNTKMAEIDKNPVLSSSEEGSIKESIQPTEATKIQRKKKKQAPDCNICQEKLTKDTFIRCPLCKQFFCKFCVEEWLMRMKNNRICPFCAKKWDDIFICNNLPLGFVANKLRLNVDGLYLTEYSDDYDEPKDKDDDKERVHRLPKIDDEPEEDEEDEPEEDEEDEPEEDEEVEPEEDEENEPEEDEENEPEENEEDDKKRKHRLPKIDYEPEENEENEPEENEPEEDEPEENESEDEPEEDKPKRNRNYENRQIREQLIDFILNAENSGDDHETINMIRALILSDLLLH